MEREQRPSFSLGRRWTFSLNVFLACVALLAVVAMANYLAARHYSRFAVSDNAQNALSPFTRNVLASITNDVDVIVFFEKSEPLYDAVWSLLKEYKYANSRISLQSVDPEKEPAAAHLIMATHQITSRNLVIFAPKGKGGKKVVTASELSDVDVRPLLEGKQEVRRTHFKGEIMFTSALLNVISQRSPKAYFLKGRGTHQPDSDEKQRGYSNFANVLVENNILVDSVVLERTSDIPADCNLLIIPGPTEKFTPEDLEKIERYLKQGGRLFALFNYESLNKQTGLEKLLLNWGVVVGNNVVQDTANSEQGPDVVVSRFGNHPMVKSLNDSKSITMIMPRLVTNLEGTAPTADAPQVERLAFTGEKARVVSDIGTRLELKLHPDDYIGVVPLAVAVEKGSLKGVRDRGSTRIVVCGDSKFLANGILEYSSNHDFVSHALNWLLARNDLLVPLAPRPVKEYRLRMTDSQRTAAGWLLLAGMPGGVLLVGSMVWLRRRS